MDDRLIAVAVPVPALGRLTYRVPDEIAVPAIGARVVVPIGPRTVTGVVLGRDVAADTGFTIKPIVRVLDADAFVPTDVVRLTDWVADYYIAGPGATPSMSVSFSSCIRRIAFQTASDE